MCYGNSVRRGNKKGHIWLDKNRDQRKQLMGIPKTSSAARLLGPIRNANPSPLTIMRPLCTDYNIRIRSGLSIENNKERIRNT